MTTFFLKNDHSYDATWKTNKSKKQLPRIYTGRKIQFNSIQNIFIEHSTWVYIEIQEYETQMGLFNSIIITCHILIFDLYFALGRNKLG